MRSIFWVVLFLLLITDFSITASADENPEDFPFLIKVCSETTGKPITKGLIKITKCLKDKSEVVEKQLSDDGTCKIGLPDDLT